MARREHLNVKISSWFGAKQKSEDNELTSIFVKDHRKSRNWKL